MIINKKIEETTYNILNELNIKAPKDIDIFKIANHLNVDVQSAILDNSISGLFVIKDSKPYIRYNVTESERRKRFTIAHELGHFVLHKDIPLFIDKNQKVLYRNSDSSKGELLKEKEANSFAASLLMPSYLIEQEIEKIPDGFDPIKYLSNIFDVSIQAMGYRLNNLGYDYLGIF